LITLLTTDTFSFVFLFFSEIFLAFLTPIKESHFLSAESISFILLDVWDSKKLTKKCFKYTSLAASGRGISSATIGAPLSQKSFSIQGERTEQKPVSETVDI